MVLGLEKLTGTSDRSQQLRFASRLLTTTESEYLSKLRECAAEDLSCFVEFMTPDEPPAPHHDYMCQKLQLVEQGELLRLTISMPPGHAKGGSLDTVLPAPGGKDTTIGAVSIGDLIYGTAGHPVRVIAKSEIFYKPCFKGVTSDGEEIVVSDDHIWTVWGRNKTKLTTTTADLYARQQRDPEHRAFRLPGYAPVERPSAVLPLDPYCLGQWLGNGTSESGQMTTHSDDHPFVHEQFEVAGYRTTPPVEGRIWYQVFGLVADLRAAGVLNNKHIPANYMRAGAIQRLALVQGLMDSDGNCRDNGGCRFTNTDEKLIDQFRELLWSLGAPNSKALNPDSPHDDGYERSPCWVVSFSGLDCFRLPRKKSRLKALQHWYGRYIRFEPCEMVPTQCIAVDSPDELFLAGRGHIVTHNTKFCSRYFPAWYLGRNPHHKWIAGGHSQPFVETQFGQVVRNIISDARFNLVFPDVRLNQRTTAMGAWSLEGFDNTYVAKGVGQGISGYRANACGIDDPFKNRRDANSPVKQEEARGWLRSDIRPRLLPRAPLFIVATRWSLDDLMGFVEQMNAEIKAAKRHAGIPWEVINLPAIIDTEEEMEQDPLGRSMGEPLWPDFYTFDELMEIKATIAAGDWWALYKGQPHDEEGEACKSAWFQRYDRLPANIVGFNDTGDDSPIERRIKRITVSVDCAEKVTKRSKYTAIGVWVEDMAGHHHLAYVLRKKMEYVEMCKAINEAARDWRADAILVEDAGNGTPYIQQYRSSAPAPVVAIPKPSADSKGFRFDAVLPMFEGGLVWLPRQAAWLADYERELLSFPNSSASDQVDMTSQYLEWVRKKKAPGRQKLRGVTNRRHRGR